MTKKDELENQTPEDKEHQEQEEHEEELSEEEAEARAGADFQSGFNKVRGELTPTPGDESGAGKDTEEDQEESEEETDEAKAEREAAEKEAADQQAFMDKLPERLRAIEGNIGGMMNKVDQAIKQVTANAATSKATPSEAQVQSALDDPEAYKDLIEDYPGFKPVLDEFRSIRETIDELRASPDEEDDDDTSEEDVKRMTEKHADWQELSQSDEWFEWSLDDGPSREEHANVVGMFQSGRLSEADAILKGWQRDMPEWWKEKGSLLFGDTDAAIQLLDNYKAHQEEQRKAAEKAEADEKQRQKKQDRLDRTVEPEGTGGDSAITVTDQKAFETGFNKVMKKSRVGTNQFKTS